MKLIPRKSLLMLLAPAALLVAGCGSSSKSSSSSSSSAAAPTTSTTPSSGAAQLSTRTLPGLGTVLVNGQGRTLYIFAPDHKKKVTCVATCASVWPPQMITVQATPAVSGQVKTSLVSSDPDPSGGRVLTYAGWPLYLYAADSGPGSATGQALNLNGGLWYVISPTGTVIKKKQGGASSGSGGASSSGSASSSGGGSGY